MAALVVTNTAGVTRTLNLRIWNPLLCQLSYWRSASLQRDDGVPSEVVTVVIFA